MQKHCNRVVTIGLLFLIVLIGLVGCGPFDAKVPHHAEDLGDPSDSPAKQSPGEGRRSSLEESKPDVIPLPVEERHYAVKLSAVGDVLIHSSIYKDAQTKDGYDFVPMLEPIRKYIAEADLAIANQETVIGGTEIGLSDYPRFNSPYEVGDALMDLGFHVVSMANNHTLDRGEKAILNAIQHWRKLGMMYTGAYESAEDQQTIRVIEKNGISFAMLAYTYGTNGIPVPKDKPYLVNLIDPDKVARDIQEARKLADVVVVNVHFGQEYVRLPDASQKNFALDAAEAGADLIIGHHPHVLQPMEWIETSDGRKAFVVYSLGNFIAAQEGVYKRIGGILQLDIHMTVRGEERIIEVREPAFIPTWIARTGWRQFSVLPMKEVTEKQLPDVEKYLEETKNHMSRWMPELHFP